MICAHLWHSDGGADVKGKGEGKGISFVPSQPLGAAHYMKLVH